MRDSSCIQLCRSEKGKRKKIIIPLKKYSRLCLLYFYTSNNPRSRCENRIKKNGIIRELFYVLVCEEFLFLFFFSFLFQQLLFAVTREFLFN